MIVVDPSKLEVEALRASRRADGPAPDDHLPTTRLAPVGAPSPPSGAEGSQASASRNASTLPPRKASASEGGARSRRESASYAKPSWLRALLTTTSPPPAQPAPDPAAADVTYLPEASRDAILRQRAAVACVVAACVCAVIALVFAFRPVVHLATTPAVVVAASVVAQAAKAIGAGALSYGFLRMAERLSSI